MIVSERYLGNKLTSAAANGNVSAVRDMLESGVRPDTTNEFGRTALQVMMMGSKRIALLLLENGANANVQDHQGITPAHDAARTGFVDTLSALLQFGASVNVPDDTGALPIHLAVRERHVNVVSFLAPHSNLAHKDKSGSTALDLARSTRSSDIIGLLEGHLDHRLHS